jgi:two-component system, NtrC family, response regulator HydG
MVNATPGTRRIAELRDDAVSHLGCRRRTIPFRPSPIPRAIDGKPNVVERACALADADIVKRRDLPEYVLARESLHGAAVAAGAGVDPRQAAMQGVSLGEARERWMAVLEGTYLRDLLDRHDGNISAAAKTAGVDRKTFHRLVSKHQIR